MQSQKRQNDLCSFPRQTIQYHKIQVYVPTSNTKEAEVEWFYENLQDLLELTLKKVTLKDPTKAGKKFGLEKSNCVFVFSEEHGPNSF